jgi:hypothetical protein
MTEKKADLGAIGPDALTGSTAWIADPRHSALSRARFKLNRSYRIRSSYTQCTVSGRMYTADVRYGNKDDIRITKDQHPTMYKTS